MLIKLDKDEFNPPVDFRLICLRSAMREYRLAHVLNHTLSIGLSREMDVNESEDDPQLPVYARYVWEDDLAYRTWILYGNRPLTRPEVTRPGDLFSSEETMLLIPELHQADYLLQLHGDYTAIELTELRDTLHGIPGVDMAFAADPLRIKNIEPLLI